MSKDGPLKRLYNIRTALLGGQQRGSGLVSWGEEEYTKKVHKRKEERAQSHKLVYLRAISEQCVQ